MLNSVARIIYYLSTISPVLIVLGIFWIVQMKNELICFPIIAFVLSILLVFSLFGMIHYSKNHISIAKFHVVDSLTPCDGDSAKILFVYILPLLGIVISFYNPDYMVLILIIALIITILVPIVLSISKSTRPNYLLLLCGYHYYKFTNGAGVSDNIIISKKEIRRKNQIKEGQEIFTYLYLDSTKR